MLTKINNWYKNKALQCDPMEIEQAKLRIIVGIVIFLFSFYSYANHKLGNQEFIVFKINLVFEFVALCLLATILHNKINPIARRLIGAWVDIGTATIFMSVTSDIGVALVIVYLWVTFGNGFRYGKKYLYHSQVLSIAGFIITLQLSPYWKTHETVGYSLLAMLFILPLYVAQLITRLNEAKKNAEEASARAAEANSAKTRFVANMSHEIRTPLNGIIGISTLFKTTPLNADQKDLLKTLDGSSKLLLSLLNNVLDFTKIEERKLTVESAAFSVEQAVNDTLEIFRSQATSKGVQLGASFSSEMGELKGDTVIVRQVLANLMGNAIKFTEKGSVTISATVVLDEETQCKVRFEVADSGVGIPQDRQHKIFDSFTQADASTTRKFGGSGLGLTIAKEMIEAMGGQLQFQSTEGVGSRFWFDLNLDKDIAEKDITSDIEQPAIPAVEPLSRTRTNAKPLNILVCEDDNTNQKILTRLLSLPGHIVDVVENADEMLDLLELKQFDLVITDLNMAGMSGTEAIKLYRFTQPNDKDTRFILFTADATLSARQEASDADFDAFLTKPVDAATLFSTIENIMGLAPNTAAMWMSSALSEPAVIETDLAADNVALDLNTLRGLERIGANDELFMHRLLKNYLADSLKLINKIEASVKQKHFGELRDYCHALKGNSLSVGALQLAQSTEDIGKLTSKNTSIETLGMLNSLNKHFSELTLAVEDYLRRPEAVSRK